MAKLIKAENISISKHDIYSAQSDFCSKISVKWKKYISEIFSQILNYWAFQGRFWLIYCTHIGVTLHSACSTHLSVSAEMIFLTHAYCCVCWAQPLLRKMRNVSLFYQLNVCIRYSVLWMTLGYNFIYVSSLVTYFVKLTAVILHDITSTFPLKHLTEFIFISGC
jgi:hypothetical protein